MSNSRKYSQIFEYLRTPVLPEHASPVIVFGRNDVLVARKTGALAAASLADVIVITGGSGKDTGDLLARGFRSEAHYLGEELAADAHTTGMVLPPILLEEKARNGGENSRFSLKMLDEHGYLTPDTLSVTAVMHATSARRLGATLEKVGQDEGRTLLKVHRVPTDYPFDPTNPIDQNEAINEVLRLADYSAQGFISAQPDLPDDFVDFARDQQQKS